MANEDFLENQDCIDCLPTVPVGAGCATTTWVLPATTACVGTVQPKQMDLVYCCTPIDIPKVEAEICADCPCLPTKIVVKSLPTNGKLTLLCVDVVVGEELVEQQDGMLVYTATTPGTAATDTFELTSVWSCGSADLDVNIKIEEADCPVSPACPTC